MRTLLIVGAAVVLMLIVVIALLRRAKHIDEHHPGLGSLDLREREARASGRGCVVKRVYAGSDLLRAQRPIAEVNERFASIVGAPELRDLNAGRLEKFYLVPDQDRRELA